MKNTQTQNTLIECFRLDIPAAGALNELNGETSTNKGQIIGIDVVTSPTLPPLNVKNPLVSVEVGGFEVIERISYSSFGEISEPGNYFLTPLAVNSGQTFQLKVDSRGRNTGDLGGVTTIVFLRDGLKTSYDRNSKLSTHRIGFDDFQETIPLPGNGDIFIMSGTIPRHKGRCIGFKITSNAAPDFSKSFSTATLKVNGLEIVKNVDEVLLSPTSSRSYNTIYTPLEGGSTFALEVTSFISNYENLYQLQFMFEKDEDYYQK